MVARDKLGRLIDCVLADAWWMHRLGKQDGEVGNFVFID